MIAISLPIIDIFISRHCHATIRHAISPHFRLRFSPPPFSCFCTPRRAAAAVTLIFAILMLTAFDCASAGCRHAAAFAIIFAFAAISWLIFSLAGFDYYADAAADYFRRQITPLADFDAAFISRFRHFRCCFDYCHIICFHADIFAFHYAIFILATPLLTPIFR
jgi:hypothetical protein